MSWREVILWFAPAFAWVAVWTQFVTLRFFDKPEGIFKDYVSSGAKDLAISNIETVKLIPALARMCDAVAEAKAAKPRRRTGSSLHGRHTDRGRFSSVIWAMQRQPCERSRPLTVS